MPVLQKSCCELHPCLKEATAALLETSIEFAIPRKQLHVRKRIVRDQQIDKTIGTGDFLYKIELLIGIVLSAGILRTLVKGRGLYVVE